MKKEKFAAVFDKLKNFVKSHKLIASLALALVLAGLGAGCYFGWQQYLYRQSADYAFEKLKGYLAPPNQVELAKHVDFNTIGRELAKAVSENFRFYQQGSDQERNISSKMQTVLLDAILHPGDPSKAFSNDLAEEDLLRKELEILPRDFVEQFAANLKMIESSDNSATISSKIENPHFRQPVTIVLGMRKTHDGWIVKNFLNVNEVVAQVRQGMLARHARIREVVVEKNDATYKKMDALLPVLSCQVNAGLLSNGKILLMVVQVLARNRGNIRVNNCTADVVISGQQGGDIMQRFLNAARSVGPGEDFDYRWNFELDSQSPLAQQLLQGIPLSCTAKWRTLGLNNAQVWHIQDVPNPDRICSIEGHDHPEGFCLTPVFTK